MEDDTDLFTCEHCQSVYYSEDLAGRCCQTRKDQEAKRVGCPPCEEWFSSPDALIEHMVESLEHHRRVDGRVCPTCRLVFDQDDGKYEEHVKAHQASSDVNQSGFRECPVCKDDIANLIEYECHLSRVHKVPPEHVCEFCFQVFNSEDIDKHVSSMHDSERYSCKYCCRFFSRRAEMVRHLKEHSGKARFECNVCGKKFIVKIQLERHFESEHVSKWRKKQQQCSESSKVDCVNNQVSSSKVVTPTKRRRRKILIDESVLEVVRWKPKVRAKAQDKTIIVALAEEPIQSTDNNEEIDDDNDRLQIDLGPEETNSTTVFNINIPSTSVVGPSKTGKSVPNILNRRKSDAEPIQLVLRNPSKPKETPPQPAPPSSNIKLVTVLPAESNTYRVEDEDAFNCTGCCKEFINQNFLEKHIAICPEHRDLQFVQCPVCKLLIESPKFGFHLSVCQGSYNVFYKCIHCPFAFSTTEAASRHQIRVHPDQPMMVTSSRHTRSYRAAASTVSKPLAPKPSAPSPTPPPKPPVKKKRQGLTPIAQGPAKRQRKENEVMKCHVCCFQTSDPTQIAEHYASNHGRQKTLCQGCKRMVWPDLHRTCGKLGQKMGYQCSICPAKFGSKGSFKTHLEDHHGLTV